MQLLDEYQLHELIGTGGMSSVYHAYQPKLRRSVAVKVLSPELAQEASYFDRFYLEASMVANLQHSHIIPIFDYGVVKDTSYFVMPFLTGRTLLDRIQRKPTSVGRLVELKDIARFLRQVGGALHYAHRMGIVHRDIKPSNIIFDEHGVPFLSDFGVASLIGASVRGFGSEGIIMGTFAYLAPEIWEGGAPSPAVDQYALGLVVYSLITGHPAFSVESDSLSDLVAKHMREMPIPLHYLRREASPLVSQVVERAIAKAPGQRFEDVLGFVDAFEKAVDAGVSEKKPLITLENHQHRGELLGSRKERGDEQSASPDWSSMPTAIGVRRRITRTSLADSGMRSEKNFVSYRSADSADITGRIYDRLVSHFGKDMIFRDLDSVPLGTNFKNYLESVVSQCVVELVVLGKTWLDVVDDLNQRQLDNPDDFIWVEIEAALRMDIPVIPLLVHGALIPRRDQLPPSLGELVYCNGISVRPDPDFDNDMARLIKELEGLLRPSR